VAPNILAGMTHAIVTVPHKADAMATGIRAINATIGEIRRSETQRLATVRGRSQGRPQMAAPTARRGGSGLVLGGHPTSLNSERMVKSRDDRHARWPGRGLLAAMMRSSGRRSAVPIRRWQLDHAPHKW
jgi:hypothetical protein